MEPIPVQDYGLDQEPRKSECVSPFTDRELFLEWASAYNEPEALRKVADAAHRAAIKQVLAELDGFNWAKYTHLDFSSAVYAYMIKLREALGGS